MLFSSEIIVKRGFLTLYHIVDYCKRDNGHMGPSPSSAQDLLTNGVVWARCLVGIRIGPTQITASTYTGPK